MAEKKTFAKTNKSRATAGPIPTIDLRQPLIILRSHILVALTLAVLASSLVAWHQLRQPKQYAAFSILVIERPERMEMDRSEYVGMELMIPTRLEQLRNPDLIARIAATLSPQEKERVLAPYLDPKGGHSGNRDQLLTQTVRGALSAERRASTTLIVLTGEHRDPAVATLLANRYAEQALAYIFERNTASNDASMTFLRNQAEDARKRAEQAERELQEYRQRFNLVSLEDNQNIIVDNLKSLNASATAARVARVEIEARLEQAKVIVERGEDPAQIASIAGFESLAEVGLRLADLNGKRAVMAQRYGRRHPAMQENERSIEAVQKLRDEQVKTALASLRDQRDKARLQETQLEDQRAKAEKEALNLDQLGVEYNILRRAVESHKASYSQILSRLNDAVITSQLRGVNMKISEVATMPTAPYSPNVQRTLLLCGALAVAILLGYPFSVELFFGRVRSASDVEFHLDSDVLGEIGSVRGVKEDKRPMLVKTEEDEAASEQFRALYSQLTLSSKIDPPKSVLITSTVPGEGKSFIAVNLAESFVAHNRRTLLVDGDLRRPTQHRHFGLDNKAGVIRWLDEGGKLDGDLLKNPALGIVEVMPGLFLLRAGGLSRRATELMDGDKLPALLAALQRSFDIVVLDTPPAGVFPDALAFAKAAHELIYICRFNTVSRNAVREVLQRLRQTGLEFPGVVLNAMPAGFAGSYYYKGYSYQAAKHYAKHYKDADSDERKS